MCTVAKTLWAAVCVGECLQNRKLVLIFGGVPIAGTGVEEGRIKKKERGRGISFGERAEPRLQETRRDNAQVAAGGRGWWGGGGENERVLLLVFAGAASVEMRVPAARLEQADVAI